MVQRLFRADLSLDLDNLILRYEDEGKDFTLCFFCLAIVLLFCVAHKFKSLLYAVLRRGFDHHS